MDFVLNEYEGEKKLRVRITETPNSIDIVPEGYGDAGSEDSHGVPILLEIYEGRLRLLVWNDINVEDPVIIDMEEARETNRKERVGGEESSDV